MAALALVVRPQRATSSVTVSGSARSSQRRKAAFADSVEGLRRFPHHCDHVRVEGDPERPQVLRLHSFGTSPEDDLETEIGEPLGEKILGSADDDDRLLPAAVAPHKADLLTDAFGVVARISLVSHEMAERGREYGEVGVDHDPRAQPPEVVI